ncbi:MAG: hypothetical protein ACLQDQ_14540 [Myxococcaceae bacterium]
MGNTVTIESGLSAYFKQPKGPSRPGVDWAVKITGERAVTIVVRTYFSTDPPRETEKTAMAEQAGRFITKKLATGWFPRTESFLEVDDDAAALGPPPSGKGK